MSDKKGRRKSTELIHHSIQNGVKGVHSIHMSASISSICGQWQFAEWMKGKYLDEWGFVTLVERVKAIYQDKELGNIKEL